MNGAIEAIFIGAREGQPMVAVQAVTGEARCGLVGDRYYVTPGAAARHRRYAEVTDLTLVEAEVLEWLQAEHGIILGPEETRRNVVTRGVRLNDLIGKRFWVGSMLCEGSEICEPCALLQRLTGKQVLRPLLHRGGLRARIIQSGIASVGDQVTLLEAPLLVGTV